LNFTTPAQQLMHGNEVMAGMLFGYDADLRRQADHTVDNIIQAVTRMFPKPREHVAVLRQLASYLVLDALIGNTDRHHELGISLAGACRYRRSNRCRHPPAFSPKPCWAWPMTN